MNKRLLSLVILSSLFLVACQDTPAEGTIGTEEDIVEDTDNSAAENDASNEDENTDSDSDPTDEAAEEEIDFLYTINPDTFSVLPIDETAEEKLVLLTFDDAPYGNSLEIAQSLIEREVSAIFFVNSMYMDEEGTEVVQQLHEMGFEIGNHTHTHALLRDYTEEEQYEEIVTTNEMIEEAIGESPRFFRAPHGVMTDYSKDLLAELNMTWMNWSFGYDWESDYQDATALADITLNTPLLQDGANILMHDRTWTAEATPAIIDGLLEQGFTIVNPKQIISLQDEN